MLVISHYSTLINSMELDDAIEMVSYKIGLRFGEPAAADPLFSKEAILQAVEDKKNGSEKDIDLKEYMAATKMVSAERSRRFKLSNEEFLTENKSKEGIISTDSGLQYKVIESGSGDSPKASDQVTVHYTGKLTDGMVFDSSVERGQPASFGVDQVISGWTEALQLMTTGAKYQLFIPQELGYGDRGVGSDIPPYATLIFDVELLSIEK